MSAVARETAGEDLGLLRRAVDQHLTDFLAGKADAASQGGALPAGVVEELRGFIFAGGKRLRPLLCLLGWQTTAGHDAGLPDPVLRAAASLEMFHAFAPGSKRPDVRSARARSGFPSRADQPVPAGRRTARIGRDGWRVRPGNGLISFSSASTCQRWASTASTSAASTSAKRVPRQVR
ncbi:hypothetical protein ABH925_005704 [Streptacidiphilus sp. EB129]